MRTGAEHDDLRHGGADGDLGSGAGADGNEERDAGGAGGGWHGSGLHDHDQCGQWPTTAAINVSDVLPAGVSTNGGITATGGPEWLSGQWGRRVWRAARSAGHQWPGGDHGTGGGGGECGEPDGEHGDGDGWRGSDLHELLGDDDEPVIDAVNDASTGQLGQAGTFNVSTNDKFPGGSTFTQTATTCVPAGTMTGAVANSPTGDDGRELHGDVQRAPAPNTTICDTAVLTVTAFARRR